MTGIEHASPEPSTQLFDAPWGPNRFEKVAGAGRIAQDGVEVERDVGPVSEPPVVGGHAVVDGNTPIDEDEAQGLRLSWVRTRGDLNDAEAANILEARRSIRSPSLDALLDDLWLRQLHKRMFGDVWSWAGTYRLSNRNLGVDWTAIPAAARLLVEDCQTWVAHDDTSWPVARFHHYLVAVDHSPRAMVDTPEPQPTAGGRLSQRDCLGEHLVREPGLQVRAGDDVNRPSEHPSNFALEADEPHVVIEIDKGGRRRWSRCHCLGPDCRTLARSSRRAAMLLG